jgi:uncharacterized protein
VKFVEYQDLSKNRIRELQADRVRIHHTWYPLPCAISAHHIVTHAQTSIEASRASIEQLITQAPADLILIGRPEGQIHFNANWQSLLVEMNQRGIGLEQMTHSAAVRTFAVLMTEERPFWLILV